MRKIVTLSVLSLGVLFLAGCGQQQTSQKQPTTPAPVAQKSAQPVVTQPVRVPVDTINSYDTNKWFVYTNDKYGYSFKYPNIRWVMYGDINNPYGQSRDGFQNNNASKSANTVDISVKNAAAWTHTIDVSIKDMQSKVDEIVGLYSPSDYISDYKKSDVVFKGIDAIQITYSRVSGGKKISDGKAIIFSKNGNTYYLDGVTKDYEKDNNIDTGIFNAILASFKFTK
jgi:hypothetical protein